MRGGQAHKKKRLPIFDQRLKTVAEAILEHKESVPCIERLQRSFLPFKKDIHTAEQFWTWVESLREKEGREFGSLTETEYEMAGALLAFTTLSERVIGGEFDKRFFILLAGYILFKKFPQKHKYIGVDLRFTEPDVRDENTGTAVITIYPNAQQAEVLAFIRENWDDIKSINQYADVLLKKQRRKTVSERNKIIWNEHREGKTNKWIQSTLSDSGYKNVSLNTISQVISMLKKKL